MADDDEVDARAVQFADSVEHALDQLRMNAAEGFVQQHQLRLQHQRAGELQQHALPARHA